MFSLYPLWPSEYESLDSDPSALRIAQASSVLYSDFARGRPVELFPAAVRAGVVESIPGGALERSFIQSFWIGSLPEGA